MQWYVNSTMKGVNICGVLWSVKFAFTYSQSWLF